MVSEFGMALGISFFFLLVFIAGFWLGVAWREKRGA